MISSETCCTELIIIEVAGLIVTPVTHSHTHRSGQMLTSSQGGKAVISHALPQSDCAAKYLRCSTSGVSQRNHSSPTRPRTSALVLRWPLRKAQQGDKKHVKSKTWTEHVWSILSQTHSGKNLKHSPLYHIFYSHGTIRHETSVWGYNVIRKMFTDVIKSSEK